MTLRQTEMFPHVGAIPLSRPRDRPSYFLFQVEVSNRFLWDNGNLPYALCGVTYLSLQGLIMKKSTRFKSNIEFVTLKLSTADRIKYDEWAQQAGSKIFKMLSELAEGGYKVSISPDFNNSCIIASITGTENCVHNVGLCMTSRADDVNDALLVMCYKHFVLANSADWLDVAGKNEDNWG